MRVLVTGAGGQLGAAVGRLFAAAGDDVTRAARSDIDLTDPGRVHARVADARPEVLVNCAAYNDVDGAEDDVRTALAVNAFGVRILAAAARTAGAVLIHYGTDFVFDGEAERPYTEDDAPNPRSVYAASKLLGEWFARGGPHYVLRVESLFGATGEPGRAGPTRRGTLDRMADALLAGRPVRAFADRTVSPTYVDDAARATRDLLAAAPPPGLYHCVGSGHATWFRVARTLARSLGAPERLVERTNLGDLRLRAARPAYSALSNAKLTAAGVAMPRWEDAVARYAAQRLGTAA
ncbi:MAG: dTDP-4-dehydrorhamnose reductase [Acidobacteria bacterium]|nr:dTDP-4-dehydrorhamnose reductase [Acidobacteriota bacterium]